MVKIEELLRIEEKNISHHWEKIEQQFDIKFPLEYKAFIDKYGGGAINDFLWILSPFSENVNLNSVSVFQNMKHYEALAKEQNNYESPFDFYDGMEGLFPFALSDNGDEIFFDYKNGNINIEVYESREMEPVVFTSGFNKFLIDILSNNQYKGLFADEFLLDVNFYTAYKEEQQ